MIFDNKLDKEAEYIGEIQENRVGIDVKNIGFITQLLTSNLYSNPIESFLREAISNAYDAHMEVGTDEFILMYIKETGYNRRKVSIRDYGTGLSPERFDDIYKNIGGSTKRASNDFIGGFGLGRLAVLSCTDVATINSYYNNTKYTYLMYKNGKGINIDKVSETQGEYKNGVEVTAEISAYGSKFKSAINKLIMFDKLYIKYDCEEGHYKDRDISDAVLKFNGRKLLKFNTFAYAKDYTYAYNSDYVCSIGNVIYEVPQKYVPIKTKVIPIIPVGSVDIVPSREALQFTPKTEEAIKKAYEAVSKELNEIVIEKLDNRKFTLAEYFDFATANWDIIIQVNNQDFRIQIEDIKDTFSKCKMFVDDFEVTESFRQYLRDIQYFNLPKESVYLKSSKYTPTNLREFTVRDCNLYYKSSPTLRGVTKDWFLNTHIGEQFLMLNTGTLTRAGFGIDKITCADGREKEYFEFILKYLNIKELKNEDVPQEYITEFKKAKNKKVVNGIDKHSLPCRVYNYWGEFRVGKVNIKYHQGPIFYGVNTQEDSDIRNFTKFLSKINDAMVITVKAEYIPLLETEEKCTALSSLTFKKNNLIAKCVTYNMIKDNLKHYESGPLYREFWGKYNKYSELGGTYYDIVQNLFDVYKANGWYNKYDVEYFKYTDAEKDAIRFRTELSDNTHNLINAIVFMKYGKNNRVGINYPKINLIKYLQK